MAATNNDSLASRGGADSNPQSPLLFTPATENKSTVAVEESPETDAFEKELEQYFGNLESKGSPEGDKPFSTAMVRTETLARDTYPMNKEQGNLANALMKKKKKDPLYDLNEPDLNFIEPTPPAMLGGGVLAGGARVRVPSKQGFSSIRTPPPTLAWGRGEAEYTRLATPTAWSMGVGATGVDKTLPGLAAAFRPVREEDEVRFRTPQAPHGDRTEEERRYLAFIGADVQPLRAIAPLIRLDSVERPPAAHKSSPGTPYRDYRVEDTVEYTPNRACKTPHQEAWAARATDWPLSHPIHSTESRRPAATRGSCEGRPGAIEPDAALGPDKPPPVRLLRQEEAAGKSLFRQLQKGTRPTSDGPDPKNGGKTFVVTADAVLALNESRAEVRDVLKLSCEYVKALQQETSWTQPDSTEAIGEVPKERPSMDVAIPTQARFRAPRAESPEPKKSRKRFDYKKVPSFDSNKMEWRDFLGMFEMAARWNEWTEVQMAQQLAMSMTGSAQKYVLRLPEATLESYSELIAAITRRYDPEEREAATLADFQNRKRRDKESVEDFGQAL